MAQKGKQKMRNSSTGMVSRAPGIIAGARLLLLLIVALALSPGVAFAQGPITNGATHTGVISVGAVHTWTIRPSL